MDIKIVFTDTNKLYANCLHFLRNGILRDDNFFVKIKKDKKIQLMIDEYVAEELGKNIFKKHHDELYSHAEIRSFLETYEITVLPNMRLLPGLELLTRDYSDMQVLNDAICFDADFLLTNNIKDFKVSQIYHDFGLQVVADLPFLYE